MLIISESFFLCVGAISLLIYAVSELLAAYTAYKEYKGTTSKFL